jgi:hypothetical protein
MGVVATVATVVVAGVGAVVGYFQTKKAVNELKASLKDVAAQKRGYEVNTRSSVANRSVIYGETKVGGIIVFDHSYASDNSKFNRIVAIAGHEVDSIQKVFLDLGDHSYRASSASGNVTTLTKQDFQFNDVVGDTLSTSGKIAIKAVDGGHTTSLGGATVPNFDTSVWTANHKLLGVAHIAASFVYDEDLFPQSVPSITALVRGKKLYDPRTATTAWSDNPALAILDYLRDTSYGVGVVDANIDFDSFKTAANVCEEIVDGAKRYTVNGFFITAQAHVDVLDQLRSSMAGHLWYSQGKWRVKAGSYIAPTLTLTEDDLRSPITVATRASRRDSANTVKGVFSGKESGYKDTEYPPVTAATFVAQDNGYENILDLNFPFTNTATEAQRLAIIALEKARLQTTVNATFGIRAFGLQIGDVVQLTNERMGFSSKTFEVTDWSFGLGEEGAFNVDLTLSEITSSVYNSVLDINPYDPTEPTFPDPYANFYVSSLTQVYVGATGIHKFTWVSPASAITSHYEVRYRQTAGDTYTTLTTKTESIALEGLYPGVEYIVEVRPVSNTGIRGSVADLTFTAGLDTTAPGVPTSVTATGGYKYVELTWVNPGDQDFSVVDIYESDTSGGTYQLVGSTGQDRYIRNGLPISVTRWYKLKARDYNGNVSAFTTAVSATTDGVDSADFTDDIVTLFTDQGLYPIEDVTSLPASGDYVGHKVYLTTDGKLYTWGGSSWSTITSDVAPGSITATEIADDAITTPKLAANAVTANEIAANTITGGLIAASGIITNSAQINDGLITNAKIGNLAVDNAKIASVSIDTAKMIVGTVSDEATAMHHNAFLRYNPAYSQNSVLMVEGKLTPGGTVVYADLVAQIVDTTYPGNYLRGSLALRFGPNASDALVPVGAAMSNPQTVSFPTSAYTVPDSLALSVFAVRLDTEDQDIYAHFSLGVNLDRSYVSYKFNVRAEYV